jgi:hypothetical protein
MLTAAEFHVGWKQALQQQIANLASAGQSTRQQYDALPIWGWLQEEINSTALAAHQDIEEHHWQTRFYQHLSPVIALVDMIWLGWCHLPIKGWTDYHPLLLMKEQDQRQWLSDWAAQDLQRALGCSVIGLQKACEWLREESTSTDIYVGGLSLEGFEEMMTDKLRVLLLAPGAWQRKFTRILYATWHLFDNAYRSFNTMMRELFEQAEGRGHHAQVVKVLGELRSTGRICAAVRTTSVDMCKLMSAPWALLSLLHCIPDVPYHQYEGERPGVRWHQPGAWHILQCQLHAMAGQAYVRKSPRAMCWRQKCRGLDSKPCKCKTVFG